MTTTTSASGQKTALEGVRVLDLTSGIAGPVAGMLLADLGADVLKLYPPGAGPSKEHPGLHVWDRNKRSAVLDPLAPDDMASLDALVKGADVVLVSTVGPGSTYGELERRGLLAEDVSPFVVVMPPYLLGETPWVGEEESAGLLFARLGHAFSQGSYEDLPVDCLYPVSLHMQGIWAAAVSVALLVGDGLGQRVGRVVVAGGAHGGVLVSPGGFAAGRDDPHIHRPGGPGGTLPNYRCYRCADGTWLFFGAFTTAFIVRGFKAIGAGHLFDDARVGGDPTRVRWPDNYVWMIEELEQIFEQRPRSEWLEILEEADVPVAPVHTSDGWLDHEQVKEMGLRIDTRNDAGDEIVMPGMFLSLSDTPPAMRSAAATKHPGVTEVAGDWPARERRGGSAADGVDLPLEGFRVLDLGTIIAGPYVSTLLGELGADVVKVERPPHGDEFRTAHGGRGGVGFSVYNREQHSVLVDLAKDEGHAAFMRLVSSADVVVENYRPGVIDRLRITHGDLVAANPLVTTVSISAFGGVGPLGHKPGFDPVVQAMSGIMRSQGGSDEANSPVFLTVPINDVLAAGLGTLGVCASLLARPRIERGQHVDITLCASASLLQSEYLVRFPHRPTPPMGGRDFAGGSPLDRIYRAADGWVRIHGHWPEDLARLRTAGLLDGLESAEPGAVGEAVAGGIAKAPVVEVLRRLTAAGVSVVKARQPRELARDEQLLSHGLLTAVDHDDAGVARVGSGRWLEMPGLVRGPPGEAPAGGEHSETVLAEVGFMAEEIEALKTAGIVIGHEQETG